MKGESVIEIKRQILKSFVILLLCFVQYQRMLIK